MSLITSQYIYQRVKEGGVYVSACKLFVSGKYVSDLATKGVSILKNE